MFDLCPRAYSNYLKYHTRHDCSQKIAKLSNCLMLSFVCFEFREEMWNGVQMNPPSLHPRTHSWRFERFLKYFYIENSCSCLRVEGLLCMSNLLSCVVEILTLTQKSKPTILLQSLHRFFEKDFHILLKRLFKILCFILVTALKRTLIKTFLTVFEIRLL